MTCCYLLAHSVPLYTWGPKVRTEEALLLSAFFSSPSVPHPAALLCALPWGFGFLTQPVEAFPLINEQAILLVVQLLPFSRSKVDVPMPKMTVSYFLFLGVAPSLPESLLLSHHHVVTLLLTHWGEEHPKRLTTSFHQPNHPAAVAHSSLPTYLSSSLFSLEASS